MASTEFKEKKGDSTLSNWFEQRSNVASMNNSYASDKTWKSAVKMLAKRGYSIMENDDMCVSGKHGERDFLMINCEEERLTVKKMRSIVAANENTTIVVITAQGATAFTRKEIAESMLDLQVFTHAEMNIAAALHQLVPKYTILSKEQRSNVIKQYYGREDGSDFPIIQITDPFVRYYNLKVGEIVCFHRSFGHNSETPYYRIVTA